MLAPYVVTDNQYGFMKNPILSHFNLQTSSLNKKMATLHLKKRSML